MSKKGWPDGPREWSPRLAKAWKHVEKLKAVIPAEMQVEIAEGWEVGQTFSEEVNGDALGNRSFRLALIVKIPIVKINIVQSRNSVCKYTKVWIYSDGSLSVGVEINSLLNGWVKGFEHLAGRWPWPGSYGPPAEWKP